MHSVLINRVNKVIDYIEQYLSEEHQLKELAQLANLSKFHFHRTFKIITKETPNEYITRKRIEKIASQLIYGTDKTISDLSYEYGFENLSSFSRTFKKFYGFSASQLKRKTIDSLDRDKLNNSKIGKTLNVYEDYICNASKIKNWMSKHSDIRIQHLPEIKLAYVRHWGSPYTIHEAFDILSKRCDFDKNSEIRKKHFITLFHDNPSLTIDCKMQQSAGIEVNEMLFKNKNEVSILTIPSQKYVVGKYELLSHEFELAWNSLIVWLNERNIQVTNGYRFEKFLNDSIVNKESSTYKVEIAIPIKIA